MTNKKNSISAAGDSGRENKSEVTVKPIKDLDEYLMITEGEIAEETGLAYVIHSKDLLSDIKVLLKQYYTATFNEEGTALRLRFNNGQQFLFSITACD